MLAQKRGFTDLDDMRLVYRGNKILSDLFSKSTHSIRQLCNREADAKGVYRFLHNERVSEDDIVRNLSANCRAACQGRYVVCLEDTTGINLSSHRGRIKVGEDIGITNTGQKKGLGFFLHPCLVVDARQGIPYGYSDVKLWNRPLTLTSKHERRYSGLPIDQKESYKWIEVSKNTQAALRDVVPGMVIVQDREGDIYEQFALLPDEKTDLLIRASSNRTLKDKTKLFSCLENQPPQGSYEVVVQAKKNRPRRTAHLEVRYKEVEITKTQSTGKGVAGVVKLWLVEAKEVGYSGGDKLCWRLLTTIAVGSVEMANTCIEWYCWRWMIEEVFRILKKEGYDIEASELESAAAVRKLSLLIMEVVIQLFLMRLAYAQPEVELSAGSCFTEQEQAFLEHQITVLEGGTEKQKNPCKQTSLRRYVWAIARLGGWKGYESKRRPGITCLWIGLKRFKDAFQGWQIHRNVSTR
jgi:hypothetical protein